MLVIIDYGMGNLGSIFNMLKKLRANVVISSQSEDIEKAQKLILPGVGSFDNGMERLRGLNIEEVITRRVCNDGVPILGICLGMQLFTKKSEEGSTNGLGWINAETKRFQFDDIYHELKIPHMGWNYITMKKSNSLLANVGDDHRFYFVHSYHVVCENRQDVLATASYGYEFDACVALNNIYGTQFHPEKSHRFGLNVLNNFLAV